MNKASEAKAAMEMSQPATEQNQLNMLEEKLYKMEESLKHMTIEMMSATDKAAYYKQIIMKIID